MSVIVRFAPSPTGIPHVGNIRTALFDYFFARHNDGTFILRIEDTDQARKIDEAIPAIKESLEWLGANWDEEHVQSARLSEYKKYAEQLVGEGKAREDEGAIRFIVPKDGNTLWTDLVGDKKIEFKNEEVEDFIILKKDGFPTYHLANVVDDHLMNVTHVIRGEDWIPSTPKHIMLYQAFSWEMPQFAHVPNVMGTDGKKLSKRRGAKSVLDYKKEGILPEALLNYLMLLGWSPKDDREILTKDEITNEFSFEKVNVAPAIFDDRKLLWMNGEYIRQLSKEDLKNKLIEFDTEINNIENFDKYLELAQTRMKTLVDFKELVTKDENIEMTDNLKSFASKLKEEYNSVSDWTAENISEITFKARDVMGVSTKDIFRVLSGKSQGLPFDQVAMIDGKEGTIHWLEKLISK